MTLDCICRLIKRRQFPGLEVRCERVESKAEFVAAMRRLAADGLHLRELHLVTHAGMYGPMFGSTAWPEQFSPHGDRRSNEVHRTLRGRTRAT